MAGLMDYLTPGQPESYITNLDPEFASQLQRFMVATPGVTIYSGARSNERQAELYQAAIQKYGSPEAARKWVAPPGKSQHNRGYAADLRYRDDAARALAHENAAGFGLNFPMKHENWHIEPIGARGGQPMAPGSMQQPAGAAMADSRASGPTAAPAGWRDYMPQDNNPIAQQGYRNFADGYGGRDLLEDVMMGQNPLRRAFMQKLGSMFS